MNEMVKAIRNHEDDNVATLFSTADAGTPVAVLDTKGESTIVTVLDDIPYGHKIALVPIGNGEQVTKYGEEIGIATQAIAVGAHVHIHNIDSIRGRGDWKQEEQA